VKLVLSCNGAAQCTFMAYIDSFVLCFEMASVWRNTFIQTSGHSGVCSRTGVVNRFAKNCFHHNTFVVCKELFPSQHVCSNSLANFKNFLY